jgi:hypothetical protein
VNNPNDSSRALFKDAEAVKKQLNNAPIGSPEFNRLLKDYHTKKGLYDEARLTARNYDERAIRGIF